MKIRFYECNLSDWLLVWVTGENHDQHDAWLKHHGLENLVQKAQVIKDGIYLTSGYVRDTNNWRKLHYIPKKKRSRPLCWNEVKMIDTTRIT